MLIRMRGSRCEMATCKKGCSYLLQCFVGKFNFIKVKSPREPADGVGYAELFLTFFKEKYYEIWV